MLHFCEPIISAFTMRWTLGAPCRCHPGGRASQAAVASVDTFYFVFLVHSHHCDTVRLTVVTRGGACAGEAAWSSPKGKLLPPFIVLPKGEPLDDYIAQRSRDGRAVDAMSCITVLSFPCSCLAAL